MVVETSHPDGQMDVVSNQQSVCIARNGSWKPSLELRRIEFEHKPALFALTLYE
jgi:hypothetical protein